MRRLYRALLDVGAVFDKNAALKSLVAAPELMQGVAMPTIRAAAKQRGPLQQLRAKWRAEFLRQRPFFRVDNDTSLVQLVKVWLCVGVVPLC